MKATRTCSIDDCEARAKSRGWCNAHYERWRVTGDVGSAPIRHFHAARERCSVDDCDRPYLAVGFCSLHWKRNAAHADPHHVSKQGLQENSYAWKAADITYAGTHRRLERYRGSATTHTCTECAGPAQQWAYGHNDPDERVAVVNGYALPYSVDPDHYRPMCRSCHKQFDLEHIRDSNSEHRKAARAR